MLNKDTIWPISSRPSPSKTFSLKPFVMAAVVFGTALLPAIGMAQGNKQGLDIMIRAQNRSTDDTPALCPGFGAGMKGDRLDVDVSTAIDGTSTGSAVFSGADGTEYVLNIDQVFVFFGGLALMDSSTRDTVVIWLGNVEEAGPNLNPVHVTLEAPRGCGNTVATFTVDVDKATTQIKFQ